MAGMTCGICLDELKDAVSTPCGHLHCEKCLTAYIELSPDAITASCPTCRASFSIAAPDLRFVPTKYHKFIIASVRRVYLDAPSRCSSDEEVVAKLEERVQALTRDKLLLMERCEAQIAAASSHAAGERDARLEVADLTRKIAELRKKYDGLKGKYKELKASRDAPEPPITLGSALATKRTSSQAALDSLNSSPHSLALGRSPHGILPPPDFGPRPTLRMPKRTRLLASPIDLKGSDRPTQVLLFKGKRVELPHPDNFDRFSESPERKAHPRHSGLPTGDLFSPSSAGGGHGSLVFDDGMDEDEDMDN